MGEGDRGLDAESACCFRVTRLQVETTPGGQCVGSLSESPLWCRTGARVRVSIDGV